MAAAALRIKSGGPTIKSGGPTIRPAGQKNGRGGSHRAQLAHPAGRETERELPYYFTSNSFDWTTAPSREISTL